MKFNQWTLGLVLAYLLAFVCACKAELPSDKIVIHAVVMEASGEPYKAQLGICAVIRERNSLHGIYGANAKRHESEKVYAQVARAWAESATNNPVAGCDSFGGVIDDKYFQGKLGLKPVYTIGHTRFYKSKKKVFDNQS